MGAITHNGEVLQGLPGVASQVNYDNSDSGLSATQVQDAIDEVNAKLGTASTKDVPVSGNASTSQVVMGNDTRLSDARPASDVSAWAKANSKPSYNASEVGAEPYDGVSTGNKIFNVGGKLQLRTDVEGGNITLSAPDGKHFMEMDINDNNNLRMYFWDNDNHTMSGSITKSVNGFTDLDNGTFVKKNNAEINGLLRNTILPSTNQQIVNTNYDSSNNIGNMWIGNSTNIDNIYFEAKNVNASITDIVGGVARSLKYRDTANNLNWTTAPGIYRYDPNTHARPSDWGVVVVLYTGLEQGYTGHDWLYQIAFSTYGGVYFRYNINATTSEADSGWSSWGQIPTMSVSGNTLNITL